MCLADITNLGGMRNATSSATVTWKKTSVLVLAPTMRSIMIDAHHFSNCSHVITEILLEACV